MADVPILDAERDALAAELALGLLSGDARAEALRLRLSDPGFAAAVAAWEARFAGLADEIAPVPPPADLWDRISARLPDDSAPVIATLKGRVRRWRMVAAGAGTLAAALALVLLARPVPPEPQLAVARIEGEAAGPLVRARFDQASGVITLDIQGFTPGPMVPELWVIPDGGAPVSLGQIVPSGRAEVAPDAAMRKLLRDGTTLAITLEPASATRHAAPSSPPVAIGKMTIL